MIITTLLFLYNLLTIKITENLHQEDSGNYSCHLPSASLSVTASLQILKGGCFSLTFKIYQTSARIFHQSTEMNIHSKLTFLIFSWTLVRVEAWDSTDSWRSRTSTSNPIFPPPPFPFPPLFSLPLPHFSSNYILFPLPKTACSSYSQSCSLLFARISPRSNFCDIFRHLKRSALLK